MKKRKNKLGIFVIVAFSFIMLTFQNVESHFTSNHVTDCIVVNTCYNYSLLNNFNLNNYDNIPELKFKNNKIYSYDISVLYENIFDVGTSYLIGLDYEYNYFTLNNSFEVSGLKNINEVIPIFSNLETRSHFHKVGVELVFKPYFTLINHSGIHNEKNGCFGGVDFQLGMSFDQYFIAKSYATITKNSNSEGDFIPNSQYTISKDGSSIRLVALDETWVPTINIFTVIGYNFIFPNPFYKIHDNALEYLNFITISPQVKYKHEILNFNDEHFSKTNNIGIQLSIKFPLDYQYYKDHSKPNLY